MQFSDLFTEVFALLAVGTLAFSAACLYAAFGKDEMAHRLKLLIGKRARLYAFVIALGGTAGSLVYSEIIGFPPCILCLWQRAFLYPQAVFLYPQQKFRAFGNAAALALSGLGGTVALYHSYTQIWGSSLLSCTAEGGACSKVYFLKYGFVSLPFMSLAAFVAIISLILLDRSYRRYAGPDNSIIS